MLVADKLRGSNISEYIIHMYKTEDLLRTYEFNLEQMNEYVISHLPVEKEEKEEISKWYQAIALRMKSEGKQESGHLVELDQLVASLSAMSELLLKEDKEYQKIYKSARPSIDEALKFADGKITNEIQICLNGIYGLLLLRTRGKSVADELMKSLNAYGDVLSYLSYKYNQQKVMSKN